ncbi:MAG: hypothetical protein A3K65_07270 [Euryarchaeota archaeon RBG_16_68_12]|nr:MAG: hypothetical protein A3K65_07270 [Euryarchaeota archaeon RBG_16_68_12]
MPGNLLHIRGLKTNFYTYQGVVRALDGIDLDMAKGEILGLVGETGCGKSVTALSILRLIPSPPGKVEAGEALFDIPEAEFARLEGLRTEVRALAKGVLGAASPFFAGALNLPAVQRVEEQIARAPSTSSGQRQQALVKLSELQVMLVQYDLLSKNEAQLRAIRGNNISMIFQEPMQALNPVFTIGDQIAESILLHRPKTVSRKVVLRMRREALRKRIIASLLDAFRGRPDLPAGVALDDPTRADLRAVWDLLGRDPSKNPALLAGLRELMALEDTLGEEATKRSVYSRWLPKVFQARVYADLWERGGWKASDVLKELESVPPLDWSDVRARDELTVSLTPRKGTAENLAKGLSEAMRNPRSSPSWQALGRVLEPPRVENGSVLLRVNPPHSVPRQNAALRVLDWVPVFRRALHHPMRRQALDEAAEMLRLLSIPDPERVIRGYPHELSGGMQQRALIAIALSCDPLLLIADEPTTALDVTIQAQILALLKELKRKGRPSLLIITHDLGVIADMCDRVCVMYGGVVVEDAPVREVFKHPLHPYTQGLIKAIPSHAERRDRLEVIRGTVPNLIYPPGGCRFHPRCPAAMPHCGWDAQDLEAAVRRYLEEIGIGPDSDVTYESPNPTGLAVSFGEGPEGERAIAHLRARLDAEREASPLLRAVTGIKEDGRQLNFTLMKSRRPRHLAVEPGHLVSCYLYEPAPGGGPDG